MTISTVDDPHSRPKTSLPPPRDGGQLSAGMSAGERKRWTWQARLKQLVIEETRAWKRLAWGAGIYFGLLLLLPLGFLLAGASLYDHVVPDRPGGAWFVGMVLQGIGGTSCWLLAIPLLLRLVRWIEAMWRRRRFSSTRGAPRRSRD